jgi:hypothetical protein
MSAERGWCEQRRGVRRVWRVERGVREALSGAYAVAGC